MGIFHRFLPGSGKRKDENYLISKNDCSRIWGHTTARFLQVTHGRRLHTAWLCHLGRLMGLPCGPLGWQRTSLPLRGTAQDAVRPSLALPARPPRFESPPASMTKAPSGAFDLGRLIGLPCGPLGWQRTSLPLRGTAQDAVRPSLALPARHPRFESPLASMTKAPSGAFNLGRLMGLEPTTPGITIQYSNQLSYSRRWGLSGYLESGDLNRVEPLDVWHHPNHAAPVRG